ncbi:MAG TPA: DUF3551 domain-containing protein [Pseudolabrys sp.]
MIRTILAAIAALVFLGLGSHPAAADYYAAPWCAVVSMGNGNMQWDCQFRTVEECVPYVLGGNRGWCNPNPYFASAYAPADKPRHRKRRVRVQ